jgi:hypothetical protein
VPLVVIAPLVGIAIVPVTLPVGAGLTPSDVSSVASSGIPVAPTDPPRLVPRGEVVPSEGIAVSGSPTSTWADAGLQIKDHAVARIKRGLMEYFPIRAEESRGDSTGGAMNSGPIGPLTAGRAAAINEDTIGILRLKTAAPR